MPGLSRFIAFRLDHGHERDIAREIRRAAPLVWDEGLGDSVRAALEAAAKTGNVWIAIVLDVAAAAWSAHRVALGKARSLPDPPQAIDGRDVAIWF